jgi:membrane protease YdiL (CAAX protease family)
MRAALPVVVQLTYTSAFGAYAGFVHLRTGHIAAAIASHSLCNYMGLPDLSFAVPPTNSAQSGQLSQVYSYRKVRHCV